MTVSLRSLVTFDVPILLIRIRWGGGGQKNRTSFLCVQVSHLFVSRWSTFFRNDPISPVAAAAADVVVFSTKTTVRIRVNDFKYHSLGRKWKHRAPGNSVLRAKIARRTRYYSEPDSRTNRNVSAHGGVFFFFGGGRYVQVIFRTI